MADHRNEGMRDRTGGQGQRVSLQVGLWRHSKDFGFSVQ